MTAPPRWDLVAVIGTKGPFPRLLDAVLAWARAHPGARVWVQHGESPLPAGLEGAERVPRDVLVGHLADAAAVVIHAGTGTIRDALALGHRPVVVARRAALGEHVNDHQAEIAAALGARIVACPHPEDAGAFERALNEARLGRAAAGTVASLPGAELRAALRERFLAAAPSRRAPMVWRALAALTRSVVVRRRGPLDGRPPGQ
ncbi:MAG: glycosyltransferase [Myxococcota bacterium]